MTIFDSKTDPQIEPNSIQNQQKVLWGASGEGLWKCDEKLCKNDLILDPLEPQKRGSRLRRELNFHFSKASEKLHKMSLKNAPRGLHLGAFWRPCAQKMRPGRRPKNMQKMMPNRLPKWVSFSRLFGSLFQGFSHLFPTWCQHPENVLFLLAPTTKNRSKSTLIVLQNTRKMTFVSAFCKLSNSAAWTLSSSAL